MEATQGSPAHLSLDSCKKVRAVRWLEAEEKTLIDEVLQWEDVLFGELKGVGIKPIGRRRSEAWAEIARTLSVRFSNASRSGDKVKKKYFNLKQRAKEKIDRQRISRGQTGGGPQTLPLSAVEETLVKSLDGRPVIHGLTMAIDTDDGVVQNSSTSEEVSDEPRNKKRKHLEQVEATFNNTIKDTEIIILETENKNLKLKN